MQTTAMAMEPAATFTGHTSAFATQGIVATERTALILTSVPHALTIVTPMPHVQILMAHSFALATRATQATEHTALT